MTLAEFRRRTSGKQRLVRVANSAVSVRIAAHEAARLFRKSWGRVEVDVHDKLAFIRVPRAEGLPGDWP